jgi:hypothetical protein
MASSCIRSRIKHALVPLFVKYNSRNGVFAVEIKSCVGLGARLEWCLEIMAYCHENGLNPQFKFSYPAVNNCEDYFGYFFEIRRTVDKCKRPLFIQISSITELNLGKDYDHVLTVNHAKFLIAKYLIIKDEVICEVEHFWSKHCANKKVLGVHYRGTDKKQESSAVPYDKMMRNINYYLSLHPDTDIIFVASDDMNFIDNIRTTAVSRPVVYRNDSFRARDGNSIHKSAATDKYAINRDAIVNCLLLSRCDALLKTASILSGWSKLFNPGLPVVVVNSPYEQWFPERELIRNNLFNPLE